MEDAHTHLLELPEDPSAAFFAVFDGHGETPSSLFCASFRIAFQAVRKLQNTPAKICTVKLPNRMHFVRLFGQSFVFFTAELFR